MNLGQGTITLHDPRMPKDKGGNPDRNISRGGAKRGNFQRAGARLKYTRIAAEHRSGMAAVEAAIQFG